MTTTYHQCSELGVWSAGSFRTRRCSRNASVCREGRWYCKQHDPEAGKARDAARRAKYEIEIAARQKKWHLERAAPAMLAALKTAEAHLNDEIRQFGGRPDCADTDTLNVIKAAIAQAEGR